MCTLDLKVHSYEKIAVVLRWLAVINRIILSNFPCTRKSTAKFQQHFFYSFMNSYWFKTRKQAAPPPYVYPLHCRKGTVNTPKIDILMQHVCHPYLTTFSALSNHPSHNNQFDPSQDKHFSGINIFELFCLQTDMSRSTYFSFLCIAL